MALTAEIIPCCVKRRNAYTIQLPHQTLASKHFLPVRSCTPCAPFHTLPGFHARNVEAERQVLLDLLQSLTPLFVHACFQRAGPTVLPAR
jgi:hypothetical protein